MAGKLLYDFTFTQRRLRLTEARRKIMAIFASRNPAGWTLKRVSETLRLDQSTVFRTLALLEKEKILHKAQTGHYYLCGVEDDNVCHQTVICNKCGKLEEEPLYDHKHPELKKFKIPVQIHEILATCNLCI